MKKIPFLFVICGVLVCGNAYSAYTKCVPSNAAVVASKPCSVEIPALNSTEWSGTCAGAPVSGVAVCVSALSGTTNLFGGYPNAVYSATAANNKICACKLTSPAVSYYANTAGVLSAVASVVGGTINTASACLQRCAGVCAAAMSSSVSVAGALRMAMFNTSLSQ